MSTYPTFGTLHIRAVVRLRQPASARGPGLPLAAALLIGRSGRAARGALLAATTASDLGRRRPHGMPAPPTSD